MHNIWALEPSLAAFLPLCLIFLNYSLIVAKAPCW